jgi:hypothetical protein
MNTDREELLSLIHAGLDGRVTDDQATRLNARLRSDAAARDLYLQLADTHSCLAVDETLWLEPTAAKSASDNAHLARPQRRAWPPLTAAAAGIAFGMFCTSVVFAYVAPSLSKSRMLLAESFESGVTKTTAGLPREAGVWSGDEAEVVNAAPGFNAHGGAKMLRFLRATYPGENARRSQWGDVYRVVDMRGLAGAGRTAVRVSASFAQGPVPAQEQFSCSVEAFALDLDWNALPSPMTHSWLQQNNSASGSRTLPFSTAREWRNISVEVPVTAETRCIMLHLAAFQTTPAIESGAVKFSGQYVDDVKVELITRP